MTNFQTQQRISYLGAPLSGDPMEVTTDMDRHFEASEEIDIDLDLTGDVQQDEEDENMGEDNEESIETAPIGEQDSRAGNDDEMADGGYVEGSIAGRSSVHDENLEDAEYLEPGIHGNAIVNVTTENSSDPSSDLLEIEEETDASGPHASKHIDQESNLNHHPDRDHHEQMERYGSDLDATIGTLLDEQKEALSTNHGESGLIKQGPSFKDYGEHSERQQAELVTSQDEPGSAIHRPSQEGRDEHHGRHDGLQYASIEETAEALPRELERATNARTEQVVATSAQKKLAPLSDIDPETYQQNRLVVPGGESSTDIIHVHPVVMVYQDSEISLFPPTSQEEDEEEEERSSTYFLEDEQLASDSIQNLLGALRSVLAESISEQDELMIDIEELGLHISEFSADCCTTSLSEVIDLYVQLQLYDGFDRPPPLYMNLTAKAKFSHRLEFLLSAVAQEKGLSQIRSSDAVEERQQLEAEGVPGPNAGDDLQADGLRAPEIKRSTPSQDGDAGDSYGDETAQHDPVLPSSLLDKPEPVLPPLKDNASADNIERDNDEASADVTNRENVMTVADGSQSEAPRTNLTKTSPRLTPTESERHVLQEPIVDDEDFINYEDDGEPAQVASSASSTLQGDMFDVIADEIDANSERDVPQQQPAELQGTKTIRRRSANEGGVTHDTLHCGVNDSTTETREQGQFDFVDHAPGYLEYSEEEDNPASSDGTSAIDKNSRDVEQPSQAQNHDDPPARNNQEEGFKQPQHGSTSLQAAVSQEQRGIVNGAHDDSKGTQQNDEQEHEHQPNNNRRDYEATGAVFHHDEYRGETGDRHENTKLAERNVPSLVGNGDVVDDLSQIGKAELQHSLDGGDHSQDDDDEITYEDEEVEEKTLIDPLLVERNSVSSTGSLKRARILPEDDGAIEDQPEDAKRIRSA